MPTYTFVNKKTKKVVKTEFMSISEGEAYVKANPELEILPGAPGIGDPWRLGRMKPPDSFRDVLRNVKKRSGGKNVNTF